MGDDDESTINDDAIRVETAMTRWVRGYDETRHDATQLQRHDARDGDNEMGKAIQRARVRRREACWCWRRWDLTINMR